MDIITALPPSHVALALKKDRSLQSIFSLPVTLPLAPYRRYTVEFLLAYSLFLVRLLLLSSPSARYVLFCVSVLLFSHVMFSFVAVL